MRNAKLWRGVLSASLFGIWAYTADADAVTASGSRARQSPEPLAGTRAQVSYGKLPLQFEANHGQADHRVRFLSRGSGYSLLLTSTEVVLGMHRRQGGPASWNAGEPGAFARKPERERGTVLRMRLIGSNPAPGVTGVGELPGKVNDFLGSDPKKWRTNISTYGKVRYEGVYPGIDLLFYGKQRELEYDFVVAPGADPKKIALAFRGADKIHVDSAGDLVLESGGGDLRLRKPLIYQETDGLRQEIPGGFALDHRHRVSFQVAAYDVTKPLVIDPVLAYASYLGGSGTDVGEGIAVDADGNAYVTGFTDSLDFPQHFGSLDPTFNGGADDAFVAKVNPTGTALLYSTYLGGSDTDIATGIAVDAAGNAFIGGLTFSADFPTTPGAFSRMFVGQTKAFVTKLNPAGSALVYSTYLGGSGGEEALGIAVNVFGNAYVTGFTFSNDFPTTPDAFSRTLNGALDAFVTGLSPAGSALLYSTYLGGSGLDEGIAIAVDRFVFYVTGITGSIDFPIRGVPPQPTFGGFYDAFIARFFANSLSFSTYLGGSDLDQPTAIVLDRDSIVSVTGFTRSADFPTTSSAWSRTLNGTQDAFVVKVGPGGGNHFIYSTFLGGSGSDYAYGIAVGRSGKVSVTGLTLSADFPTTPGAVVGPPAWGVFVTRLNGSALDYSTYLGNGSGNGIALDPLGNVYVTGGAYPGFPVTPGVFGPSYGGGGEDAFVAKLNLAEWNSLTVVSQVVNDDGGTKAVGDFQLRVDGLGAFSGVPRFLTSGVHRVTEDPVAGYAVSFGGDCASDGSISFNLGEVKNCTVTNDDIAPRLTVTKVVVNDDGGTRQATDFPLFVDGGPISSGAQNSFFAGGHTISEASSPGYAAKIGGDCAANGSISLNLGDVKNCTITNNDIPSIYLHGTANSFFLDSKAPTATTPKSRDSASVVFSGGNPWKEVGTWTASSAPFTGSVVGLNNVHVFVGLKSSDDEGRRFDVRTEVYRNGALLTSGETICVTGVTRNPDKAKEVVVASAVFPEVVFNSTDTLLLKVLTRTGTNASGSPCGGVGATGLRLYFDAVRYPSRLGSEAAP